MATPTQKELVAPLVAINDPGYWEGVARLEAMKEEAMVFGNWNEVLILESSYARLPKLIEIWPKVPPDQRRQLLADNWDCCDGNLWQYRNKVIAMFREVGYVGDLGCPPEPIRLYRGTVSPRWSRGVSWTTNLRIARFFADGGRFGPMGGFVYTVDVPREAILAGLPSGTKMNMWLILTFSHTSAGWKLSSPASTQSFINLMGASRCVRRPIRVSLLSASSPY
jgi:hypothetical protein